MNLGQALISIGHGCYKWRQDISPGFSVLAREATRNAPQLRNHIDGAHYKKLTWQARELNEFARKLVRILFDAHQRSTKLGFAELCEQAGVPQSSGYAKRTLTFLQKRGLVHREGKNRGAVYWAEAVL